MEVNLPLGTLWHPHHRADPGSVYSCILAVPLHLQSSWNRFLLEQETLQPLAQYVISTKLTFKERRKKGKIHYPVLWPSMGHGLFIPEPRMAKKSFCLIPEFLCFLLIMRMTFHLISSFALQQKSFF